MSAITSVARAWRGLVGGRVVFYGWWIVAAHAVVAAVGGGVYIYGFTAFFLPVATDFHVGRGTMSLAVGVGSLVTAAVGPALGMLVDRYGPRAVMLGGIALVTLGFVLISTAQTVGVFLAYFIPLIAVGSGAGMFTPTTAAVGNWFVRKRALAFAIAYSGFGLGGLLVVGTNFLVETLGWRQASLVIAGIVLATGMPLAFVMRRRPEDYGLLPDGERGPQGPVYGLREAGRGEGDLTVREAVLSQAFWLLALSFAARIFVIDALGTHFIPLVEDKGFTSSVGASLLALFGVITIPARLVFGYFGDRLPKAAIIGWSAALMGVAMLILALSDHMSMLILAVTLYAVSWGGGGGSMMAALRADFFGRRHFATIAGFSSLVATVGVAGPIFAGFSYDRTGGYQVAYYSFVGASVLSAALVFFARRPTPARLSSTG